MSRFASFLVYTTVICDKELCMPFLFASMAFLAVVSFLSVEVVHTLHFSYHCFLRLTFQCIMHPIGFKIRLS